MEELKSLIPVLSFFAMLLFGFGALGYQQWNKRNDAIAKQKALDEGIAVLKEHADDILKEHCDKSELLIEKITDGMAELNKRLSAIETAQAVTQTKLDFVFSYLEKNITTLLRSPDHPRKDILLAHLSDNDITLDELEELRNIFDHEKDEVENKDLKWAYTGGMMLITRRIEELRKDRINESVIASSRESADGSRHR